MVETDFQHLHKHGKRQKDRPTTYSMTTGQGKKCSANGIKQSAMNTTMHIYFCTSFFCIFIFVYLIKMPI